MIDRDRALIERATLTDKRQALTYEEAEKRALRAIHDADGRGMVGRGRNHLHQRVARAILSAARDEGRAEGLGGELDEPTRWLLRYVDASGGKVSASEYRGNPIDLWCDDRGQETDTLNVAIEDGLLSCSHNSDTDESWVWLTDAGRRALPAPPASQTQEG